MQHFILGRTGLEISRTGFGALPIQRVSFEEADRLLNRALDGGITYIDTARVYSDSEEKIGRAIGHRRSEYTIATKSMSKTAEGFNRDLEESLRLLKTDVIDVYQFHNPNFVPVPGGEDGLYEAALKAREAGKIRFIGTHIQIDIRIIKKASAILLIGVEIYDCNDLLSLFLGSSCQLQDKRLIAIQ